VKRTEQEKETSTPWAQPYASSCQLSSSPLYPLDLGFGSYRNRPTIQGCYIPESRRSESTSREFQTLCESRHAMRTARIPQRKPYTEDTKHIHNQSFQFCIALTIHTYIHTRMSPNKQNTNMTSVPYCKVSASPSN